MSFSAPRPTAANLPPYRWLWCDDHVAVTRWFMAQNLSYKRFYGSFINFCNCAWERSKDAAYLEKHGGLEYLDKAACDCLRQEVIPAGDLVEMLERYKEFVGGSSGEGRYKETGIVSLDGPLDPDTLLAGSDRLYKAVFNPGKAERETLRGIRKGRRRVMSRNDRRAADVAAAHAAGPVPGQQPGLADQRPLPSGLPLSMPPALGPSFFSGTLPAVQKPMSLASLGVELPAVDPAAPVQQTQQQPTLMQHGDLVVRLGEEENEDEGEEDEEDEEMEGVSL